jgi:hypothetical protein
MGGWTGGGVSEAVHGDGVVHVGLVVGGVEVLAIPAAAGEGLVLARRKLG